jgi:hypothetical protein
MKRNIPLITFFVIILGLISFVSCSSKENKVQKSTSKKPKVTFSASKYKKICKLAEKLNFKGYKLVYSTADYDNFMVVEKSLTFNKRKMMSTNGNMLDPTQERLIFESDDKKSSLFLDIIFLEKDLYNDLVYSNPGIDDKELDPKILEYNYHENIFSYKNLLVKFTDVPLDKNTSNGDYIKFNDKSLVIVNFLKSLKK